MKKENCCYTTTNNCSCNRERISYQQLRNQILANGNNCDFTFNPVNQCNYQTPTYTTCCTTRSNYSKCHDHDYSNDQSCEESRCRSQFTRCMRNARSNNGSCNHNCDE